jgi:hypothetical protein
MYDKINAASTVLENDLICFTCFSSSESERESAKSADAVQWEQEHRAAT